MGIKQSFSANYGAAAGKGRYSLSKIRAQSPESYSVDKLQALVSMSGRRCDYFVFCMNKSGVTGIYLIEEKTGGNPKQTEVKLQLQDSAKFIEKNLQKGESFNFLPVFVSGKGAVPSKRVDMRRVKISLGGKEKEMKHVKPGMPLQTIV